MDTGDLADAVRGHRVVEVRYTSGDKSETRIIHPDALYRTAAGDVRLEAVQVGGATSGELPGWRAFELMRIVDVRVLSAVFEPAADYNPTSPRYHHGLLASAQP